MTAPTGPDRLRARLAALPSGVSAAAVADHLCRTCVELLDIDGAAISLWDGGTTRGTVGSSGELSRRLDALQFTFGEGPCVDAVGSGMAVLVPDLLQAEEVRWPAFSRALMESGVHAVFALPVQLAAEPIGALDLFRYAAGDLREQSLVTGLAAADLAAAPLLKLMTSTLDADVGPGEDGWEQLASLSRVEVHQATGMVMGAWDVDAVEALVRLRAHAYAVGSTATELACAIVERRQVLGADDWVPDPR